jgi:hypothetical protein
MRTSTKTQPTIRLHEVKTQGRRIHLRAELELDLPLPAQDEHLPATLERAVEDAGQRLKRLLFGQALEHADLQLLLRHTAGKRGEKVRRRGASYTLRPSSRVKVRRSRLQDKKSGVTHQPAALAWQTPQQVCITQGLRHAAEDALLTQSAHNALDAVEARAGETGLLCKAELLNIAHREGQDLRQAARGRAETALDEHAGGGDCCCRRSPGPPGELAQRPQEVAAAAGGRDRNRRAAGFAGGEGAAEAVAWEEPRMWTRAG